MDTLGVFTVSPWLVAVATPRVAPGKCPLAAEDKWLWLVAPRVSSSLPGQGGLEEGVCPSLCIRSPSSPPPQAIGCTKP